MVSNATESIDNCPCVSCEKELVCEGLGLYDECPLIAKWVLNPASTDLLDSIFEERREKWLRDYGVKSVYDHTAYARFKANPKTMSIPLTRRKYTRVKAKTDARNNTIWRGRMQKLNPVDDERGPW